MNPRAPTRSLRRYWQSRLSRWCPRNEETSWWPRRGAPSPRSAAGGAREGTVDFIIYSLPNLTSSRFPFLRLLTRVASSRSPLAPARHGHARSSPPPGNKIPRGDAPRGHARLLRRGARATAGPGRQRQQGGRAPGGALPADAARRRARQGRQSRRGGRCNARPACLLPRGAAQPHGGALHQLQPHCHGGACVSLYEIKTGRRGNAASDAWGATVGRLCATCAQAAIWAR